METKNIGTELNNILKEQLTDAYEFFGLTFPTTEAAVNEAYFNKQRSIREQNPAQQYSLKFEADTKRKFIIEHLDIPVKTRNDEEIIPYEEVNTSVFVTDEDIKPEEFVSWEEAINANQISSRSVNNKKYTHFKRKRKHKHKKLIKGICAIFGAGFLYILGTFVLMALNVHTAPSNNELYEIIREQGIVARNGQIIPVNDEIITDFKTPISGVTLFGTKAFCMVSTELTNDLGLIKADSVIIFKRKDGTWKYKSQDTTVTLIQHDLSGVWEGPYKASKDSTTTSSLRFEIEEPDNHGIYNGTCFITSQKGVTGSYSIKMKLAQDNVSIQGVEWLEKPTFFIMEDFDCFLNIETKELLPKNDTGAIFSFVKVSEDQKSKE